MASFHDLTTVQLKQAVQIREEIESLQGKLDALLGGSSGPTKAKRKMSASHHRKDAGSSTGTSGKGESTDQATRADGREEKRRHHS